MTSPTLDLEPACPGTIEIAPELGTAPSIDRRLRVEPRPFGAVDRPTWERLASLNPWVTPFSSWAFHRAWWDAYGSNAHDETLIVCDAGSERPIAIVPFMHRHEVEPRDLETGTRMRQPSGVEITAVPDNATAIFFGASYHADYATILAAPADLPDVTAALAEHYRSTTLDRETPWDALDLRRLRCGDPSADALLDAFACIEIEAKWTVNLEREDVCPVVTLPEGADLEGYLSTLGKKSRHEIRRKMRRAEGVGEVRLIDSTKPLDDLEVFIDLHQRKWGDKGLFKPGEGGRQSRVFFRRMFELFGVDGPLRLAFLYVGDRRIAAGITFETPDATLYYNAGVDPDSRDLSPGVLMVAAFAERALERGARRLDFLRGNEQYKYEWGAVDEPVQRLLVRRTESR